MSKIRIYELARDLNLDSKKIVGLATELGMDVKNHMSNLEPQQVEVIKQKLNAKGDSNEQAPKASKSKPTQKPPAQSGKKEVAQAKPIQLYARPYTVAELEKLVNIPSTRMIKALIGLGVMANVNQSLDSETVEILLAQLSVEYEIIPEPKTESDDSIEEITGDLETRPPVVTVLGHVDHGKTSLLDAMRHANVTASEAGGITQHIGAYQVEHEDKKIVFLDTPGHEAFTSMRARGAKVTDIAILVVAADEGVKPQTIEALNHAKAAGVPVIVALNKMDKPGANPDRVKQQLSQYDLAPEDWGGDTIYVEVSAQTGDGIDQLLEMILLVAEMSELQAVSECRARGTIIEAKLDKGRGPVATVLLQHGTLRVGDPVFSGSAYGKIRAMFDDKGQRVISAGPAMPVEIWGLSDVPEAGALLECAPDEKTARQCAEKQSSQARDAELAPKSAMSLDDVFKQMEQGEVRELNLLIKSDVQGTTEALKQALSKIQEEDIKVNIIHDGVGAINSSDIMLASASNAIIIGFNVRPDAAASRLAEEEKIEIRLYRIIYEVIEDVKAALKGLLDPEFEESVIGRAEVRNLFKFSKLGTIAGSYVTDGKLVSSALVRLIRDGVVIYEGKLSSLKRFKDDVKEVNSGYECGITLENFQDIKEGDIIEGYVMKQK
ncbi:MAG: translation initiation factor IF-2 [Firmicutes bacterium]|nr:translation initiation factor IF-2 [Bacillota bacterium]